MRKKQNWTTRKGPAGLFAWRTLPPSGHSFLSPESTLLEQEARSSHLNSESFSLLSLLLGHGQFNASDWRACRRGQAFNGRPCCLQDEPTPGARGHGALTPETLGKVLLRTKKVMK